LIEASESTPQPFSSNIDIFGASMRRILSFGQIPRFRDSRPTYERRHTTNIRMYIYIDRRN